MDNTTKFDAEPMSEMESTTLKTLFSNTEIEKIITVCSMNAVPPTITIKDAETTLGKDLTARLLHALPDSIGVRKPLKDYL